MIFSSAIFLFFFLPLLLLIYFNPFFKTIKIKNVVLLIASLFFYAWGEPIFVFVMIGSIIINYLLALCIQKYNNLKKLFLAISVAVNVSVLFVFKYLSFVLTNLNYIFYIDNFARNIALPIGISFFTFQILSYVFDVYYKKVEANKNIIEVGLYISCFPQLISGPIVRYNTIIDEIKNRRIDFDCFSSGVVRFIIGLAKKIILADQLAILVNISFCGVNTNSVVMSWLGVIAYAFQIYFDFSGYSDMAIGLGRMFGFHYEENFNYPYISKSVTEFWRRWHISLGQWIRDYIYIPLGGNRVSKNRLVFNLLIVWLLVGIWHGANWTFIIWGLIYFVFITIEKLYNIHKSTTSNKIINIGKHFYTMLIVVICWTFFRADNLTQALAYVKNMFWINSNNFIDIHTWHYVLDYCVLIIIAVLASVPLKNKIKITKSTKILYAIYISLIFIISVIFVISGSYSQFIYFNF